MSRLAWLVVGVLLGAGIATVLARRAAAAAPTPPVERAALPAPAPVPTGRHAWVPPGEADGPAAPRTP